VSTAQIPVLCRTCGGPVDAQPDLSLRCPYCGTEDRLPQDELSRALELKGRIARAANAVAQVQGFQGTLSTIFEERGAYFRVTGIYLVLGSVILVYTAVQAYPTLSSVPPEYLPGMIVTSLSGGLFVFGLAAAFAIALAIGRISYRRNVRPQLLARAPKVPGAPARCRGCGGELADEKGPLIRCRYCSTPNLVTPEIQRDRERLLAAETESYRARARGAIASTSTAGVHMTRTLIIAIIGVYAGMIGLAALGNALFPKNDQPAVKEAPAKKKAKKKSADD
jgi:DNA-directed RNA polymerase subunit RPC12/RpoP